MSGYLLDTHLLLWIVDDDRRLPLAVRGVLDDPEAEVGFSVASIWEVAIKARLAKAGFHVDPRRLRRKLMEGGLHEVGITAEHAITAAALPMLHRDPFDRMLVAQSTVEDAVLLTVDQVLARYPGPVRLLS